MTLPCPACGFLTGDDEIFGSYVICAICGWEDDGVQLANPACGGGANGEALIEAQAIALVSHPLNETEFGGIARDSSWRPLRQEEIDAARREAKERYWKHVAVLWPCDAYWNKDA